MTKVDCYLMGFSKYSCLMILDGCMDLPLRDMCAMIFTGRLFSLSVGIVRFTLTVLELAVCRRLSTTGGVSGIYKGFSAKICCIVMVLLFTSGFFSMIIEGAGLKGVKLPILGSISCLDNTTLFDFWADIG